MKKNNDNKKIKTNICFCLSLFVNLESCCIAWEAAVKRLDRWRGREAGGDKG